MLARLLRILRPAPPTVDAHSNPRPDAPQGFGYKTAWFAVRTDDPHAVAQALRLRDVRPTTWSDGVESAYTGHVFITPPIGGWVLAAGRSFAPLGRAPEPCLAALRELSQRFGDAQYFATHRVVELCAWARAREGELQRAYCFTGETGETMWDEGARLDGEPEIDPEDWPGEEDVMALAGRWSLDPTTIGALHLPPSLGLTGRR